jgi:ribosomal protein S18 acetylase RimI-like enzyme
MVDVIRADETHADAICKLWWEFLMYHQDIEPIFILSEDSIAGFRDAHLGPHLASDDGLVLVALEDARAVGFSISEIRKVRTGLQREPYGYVDTMAVTAEYRRKGVGREMFDLITAWFQVKGVKRVELGADSRNAAANAFWQKMGFAVYHHELYRTIEPG